MLKATLVLSTLIVAALIVSAADQPAPATGAPAAATKKGGRGRGGPGGPGGANQAPQPPPVAAPALYYKGTDIAAAIAAKEKQRAIDGLEFPSERLVTGAPKEGVGAYHLSIVTRHVPNMSLHATGSQKGTEIHFILDGGGMSVTGGTIVDDPAAQGAGGAAGPRTPRKVVGGVTRHVTKGDMVIIPAGSPHGYTSVDGVITYAEYRFDVHPSLASLVETQPLDGKNHSDER